MTHPAPWWRDAVVYQLYIRSFSDADGDGIGDIGGMRSRLPYLRDLGVDAVWVNPWFVSPMVDGGYDVADYRDIDPLFGTLADAEAFIDAAHALDIRVLLDIVPNHTSDRHPWFSAALAAGPGSRERDFYVFRDGRGRGGGRPPTDWPSVFGGPAWTRVVEPDGKPGQWYLHLFAPEQPDLDWTEREVRAEFESILRFWFDRGADGFRIDVAHGLVKDPAFPDLGRRSPKSAVKPGPYWDQDGVHDVYRSWRAIADEYADRVFVAEVFVPSAERLARYLRSDELHTAFDFKFLLAGWDVTALRDAIDASLHALAPVGAPATWVLSNHDQARHVTRFGRAGGRSVRSGQRRRCLEPPRSRATYELGPTPGPRSAAADAGAARLHVSVPGRRARARRGRGSAGRVAPGPDLGADRAHDPRPRRLPGAAAMGRRRSRRSVSGRRVRRPWLPQPASWSERTVRAPER